MNSDNPLNIAAETIHQDIRMDSEDDDDDMLSSAGSYDDDDGLMTSGMTQDEVTAQLAAAGPVGVAAAAAIASAKKRKRPHAFETNPSIRKRQQTRLIRKLKQTIDEYTTRVGQQAVVMFVTPGKPNNSYKVFGAKPLEDVMRALRVPVMQELEAALSRHAPPPVQDDPSRHELPPLVIDGIPTPVEKMTQAQLRAFIPLMLKYSTGKGKPGWGKLSARPDWWPKGVPWANVRMDNRNEEDKAKVSWTHALRQIVINCYRYHGRDDLLPAFSDDDEVKSLPGSGSGTGGSAGGGGGGAPGGVIRTAPPKLNLQGLNVPSQYSHTVVQTISNPDGTVSIIHVDPNNPVITLPDGTQAHVQGVTTPSSMLQADGLDGDGGQTMNIDLSSVTEATINAEGHLVLNGVGDDAAFSAGNMVTIPISSSMYHTVVANVQHVQSADGQTLQVSSGCSPVHVAEEACSQDVKPVVVKSAPSGD
ncbi:DNA-binding protein P3A2-like isoform X1 [Amphibalanus amphitrite]|uniref:DNA-binding protein P3A2-like isoform X2 n=1 Tax=Amphibalanus amphitrite TaxID=1232801 RepID=UPI001C919383|nr:DNA-binding protein P3A2-like isoform X2 [Amphibalanus amphitrite]XP_043192662.1 DNA-binding protein P3A2-like isoform X2 [Amphibalanus amphitrite]XP_043192663.1 DNA-binding protein P3A2-like isoform X2 [Amphibalanus amphitrite]XP_043192665.1 DNA-binding protein P3A2-like isoform X2 [Amphibalanus amphitrite]XP_043226037.1 DNA-binding protein P3A2-like isoform X1 [Amphibalanus amphitrite]XP_043226038.1 DNA-binding protein P3A2-like isoform X1 [Amphibalanus amphitrite]XP_043226039.1 DNA-bind